MSGLTKKMPKVWLKKSEDWSGVKGNIITTSENGEDNYYNGIPAFDYYEEASHLAHEAVEEFSEVYKTEKERKEAHKAIESKPTYEGGIHNELVAWLKERGWYGEWEDAGTLCLTKL